MQTEPPVIETEIVTEAITLVVPEKSLPPSMLANIEEGFRDAFAQAEVWRQKALAIKVESASDTGGMKMARLARLELRKVRVEADHKRKAMKEESNRYNNAVQGAFNILLAAVEPLEKHLLEMEEYGERLLEQKRQELIANRHDALKPYIAEGQPLPPLDGFTEDQWTTYLADAKLLHEAKLAEIKRVEAERIAREQAEAAEREKMRIENERLQQEAKEREAQLAAERERVEAERKKAEAAAKAAEEKARKEREEAEVKLRAAEAKAQQESEAAAKKAAEEKAAIEAKAAAARKKIEDQARAELAEANAALAKEKAAREKVEAEKKAKEEAAAKAAAAKVKAEAAAKAKASRAPDREKVRAMLAAYEAVDVPTITDAALKSAVAEFQRKYLAAWNDLANAIAE